MTAYKLSSPYIPSSFALKSKEKRAAQLAEVRKRRAEIYKVFAEKRRVQNSIVERYKLF